MCFDRVLVLTQAFKANPIHAAYLREAEAGELEQAFRISKTEVSLDLSNKGISNAGAAATAASSSAAAVAATMPAARPERSSRGN